MILRLLAAFSLLVCLAAPFLFFWGYLTEVAFRAIFAVTSAAWFVFAGAAIARK